MVHFKCVLIYSKVTTAISSNLNINCKVEGKLERNLGIMGKHNSDIKHKVFRDTGNRRFIFFVNIRYFHGIIIIIQQEKKKIMCQAFIIKYFLTH